MTKVYNYANKATKNMIAVIANKLAPHYNRLNLNIDMFCSDYDNIRETVSNNLVNALYICPCGYSTKQESEDYYDCPICGDEQSSDYIYNSKLAHHIVMSEDLNEFINLYKEKFYGK